ncbi:uncharacterized protein LACBIDRAFT_316179 [Laccaria bicolor S238N-H82]|uniref:Predicted protein n=1 Tax=Laccaria bicolor (strain S238N-H82 / ATCC MYA-4686) TaxID=486041 RepID=B0E0C9_LACBS|nr:uncharacterized protein LACBIDRAFT_316179 [Laccaria bicolor S238N-H82]EDQ99661.1 predicted protein [Laccaria bicolor S238N-H82]|eukprot:XP_001889638.1 predicted protein [Laccaria bicolor S238N-H82]
MEDPQLEIRDVLRLIVSSPSADDQAAAVKKYFIHNAGFNHPLFHIEPGPSSRSTILGVYQYGCSPFVERLDSQQSFCPKESLRLENSPGF